MRTVSRSSSRIRGDREVNMNWITRKDIKVDRVACPWLIKKFVDPQAEFLFVEEQDLLEQSKKRDAIPFDAPRIETIKLNHRGPRCTFEAIIEDYALSDLALQKLALIVRAADIKGQESVAAEGIGLDCSGVCCNGHIGRTASCQTIPDLRCPIRWDQECGALTDSSPKTM